MRRLMFMTLGGWLAACSGSVTPAPTPTASANPSATTPIAAASVSASAAPTAAPTASAGPPALAPGSGIGCGTLACRPQSEVCCLFSDGKHACAPRRGLDGGADWPAGDAHDVLVAQKLMTIVSANVESCEQTTKGRAGFEAVRYCDSAADCKGGHSCCVHVLPGGSELAHCAASCDVAELCNAKEPCRTPATRCSDGICRTALPMDCAGVSCGAPNVCCLGNDAKPTCLGAEACRKQWGGKLRAHECSGPKSCGGRACQINMGEVSFCSNVDAGGNNGFLCDTAADCKGVLTACPDKPACKADKDGMRACDCP